MLISKKDRLYPFIRSCIAHRAKDNIKPAFYYSYVTKDRELCCCDYRRLAVLPLGDLVMETGYWQVIAQKDGIDFIFEGDEKEIGQFPDWKQVIPEDSDKPFAASLAPKLMPRNSVILSRITLLSRAVININYLNDLPTGVPCQVHCSEGMSPVKFVFEHGFVSVIMPIMSTSEG